VSLARRLAALDLGSNSVKLCVAEASGGAARILADEVRVCGLARGMDERTGLAAESMERCLDALAELRELGRSLGAEEWAVAGTEALRRAANAEAFAGMLRERTGLELEIIPGDEEARLALRAALWGMKPAGGRAAVFDTGGASTELVLEADGPEPRRMSLPLGVVTLTERFRSEDLVPDELFLEMRAEARRLLEPAAGGIADPLVGIGGTVTSLAALREALEPYDPLRIQGMDFPKAELEDWAEKLCSLTLRDREALTGLMPARAPVMPAGAAVVLAVLDLLDADALRVSAWGLRHALLSERWNLAPSF